MACSSDRIGRDIVLLSIPPIFRGTLDVLSLVPGAHLPVKVSHFHPQFPAFRLIRPGARHRTASSLTFRSIRSGAPAQNGILPDLSVDPLRRFGTERHPSCPPVPALPLRTASQPYVWYRAYGAFGVNADQGCRNVECIPDRRDQGILIPPFLGRFSERLE